MFRINDLVRGETTKTLYRIVAVKCAKRSNYMVQVLVRGCNDMTHHKPGSCRTVRGFRATLVGHNYKPR